MVTSACNRNRIGEHPLLELLGNLALARRVRRPAGNVSRTWQTARQDGTGASTGRDGLRHSHSHSRVGSWCVQESRSRWSGRLRRPAGRGLRSVRRPPAVSWRVGTRKGKTEPRKHQRRLYRHLEPRAESSVDPLAFYVVGGQLLVSSDTRPVQPMGVLGDSKPLR